MNGKEKASEKKESMRKKTVNSCTQDRILKCDKKAATMTCAFRWYHYYYYYYYLFSIRRKWKKKTWTRGRGKESALCKMVFHWEIVQHAIQIRTEAISNEVSLRLKIRIFEKSIRKRNDKAIWRNSMNGEWNWFQFG